MFPSAKTRGEGNSRPFLTRAAPSRATFFWQRRCATCRSPSTSWRHQPTLTEGPDLFVLRSAKCRDANNTVNGVAHARNVRAWGTSVPAVQNARASHEPSLKVDTADTVPRQKCQDVPKFPFLCVLHDASFFLLLDKRGSYTQTHTHTHYHLLALPTS